MSQKKGKTESGSHHVISDLCYQNDKIRRTEIAGTKMSSQWIWAPHAGHFLASEIRRLKHGFPIFCRDFQISLHFPYKNWELSSYAVSFYFYKGLLPSSFKLSIDSSCIQKIFEDVFPIGKWAFSNVMLWLCPGQHPRTLWPCGKLLACETLPGTVWGCFSCAKRGFSRRIANCLNKNISCID